MDNVLKDGDTLMVNILKLNDRGLRELLSSVAECRIPLQVRLRDAEQRAALAESEANSLRKVSGMLDAMRETLEDRLKEVSDG